MGTGSGGGRRLLARAALAIGVALATLVLAEGLTSLALAWYEARGGALTEEAHCEYDPELGWVGRKSVQVPDLYGPGLGLCTNERGFRGGEEHAPGIPTGRYRTVCLGDSFTLGHGVDDESSFPALLSALEPRIQTVNMGQGGYGIDQCYLWYLRDGTALEADLLLLSFIAPDFERMLDERFQDQYPKPRLTLEAGQLRRPNSPLPRDWERGAGARRLRRFLSHLALSDLLLRLAPRGGTRPPDANAPLPYRELAEFVLADLARLSRERGQSFALVHLPLRDAGAGNPAALLAWLRPYARSLDVPLIDLEPAFARLTAGQRAACYLPDGHLSACGNRQVAETLLSELRAILPGFPRE
jgi:hypothetical protein